MNRHVSRNTARLHPSKSNQDHKSNQGNGANTISEVSEKAVSIRLELSSILPPLQALVSYVDSVISLIMMPIRVGRFIGRPLESGRRRGVDRRGYY